MKPMEENQLITETAKTQEIISLHKQIEGHLRLSLDKAIRIGQLLSEQKESVGHGNFTTWIKDHLPFTDRTARNYIRLYHQRDRLKTETISDLKQAYDLLIEHRDSDNPLYALSLLEEACNLVCEAKRTLLEEIESFTYQELVEVIRIATEIEKHCLEIKLNAAYQLGEIQNREGRVRA